MANDLLSYPLNMNSSESRGNGDHRVTFVALKPRFNSSETAPEGMVALYLPPDALKTSYSQSYGDVELGGVGIAALEANQEAADAAQRSLINMDFSGALSALSGATNAGSIAQAIGKATLSEAATSAQGKLGTAVQALGRKVGKIRNPHKALIYQGPGGFRTFSFSFVMMPKSKKEAEEINKIVHYFKYHMHPGTPTVVRDEQGNPQLVNTGGNINSSSSLMLSYPEEFKIRITPRGTNGDTDVGSRGGGRTTNVKPLFRIDRCFLESLNVDYTTSGQPVFFDDGNEPVTTTLQLSFKETRLMTKESISRGF